MGNGKRRMTAAKTTKKRKASAKSATKRKAAKPAKRTAAAKPVFKRKAAVATPKRKAAKRASPPARNQLALDEVLARALQATEQGDYKAALGHATKAVALAPGNYLAYSRMAIAQYLTGDPEVAITTMRACLALNPQFAGGHYNLACLYALEGKRRDALASLKRAIDLQEASNPTPIASYRRMAPSDSDFADLHDDDQFRALCGTVELVTAVSMVDAGTDQHRRLAVDSQSA